MVSQERCFKPGRDLFQLLISIWCKEEIRKNMNSTFIDEINSLLIDKNNNYSKVIEHRMENSKWSYNLTADDNFSFLQLVPIHLLTRLYELKHVYDN